MAALFANYRIIPASSIVRSNIRLDRIRDDLDGLIDPLETLTTVPKPSHGSPLNQAVAEKLAVKRDLLGLLQHYGYRSDGHNNYFYQASTSSEETEQRFDAVAEIKRLLEYLRNAKHTGLGDLSRFLEGSLQQNVTNRNTSYETRPQVRATSAPTVLVPPPPTLPTPLQIQREIERTREAIESLKLSLLTDYDVEQHHGFIRRKLAMLQLKQQLGHQPTEDDSYIDQIIDENIAELKNQDQQADADRTDNVYLECLIRCAFNQDRARDMINNKRPNLTPPVRHVFREQPAEISLLEAEQHLQEHCEMLDRLNLPDDPAPDLEEENRQWRNVQHIIPALQQLHRPTTDDASYEALFSRIYRLFYSELSHAIGPQLESKLEVFIAILLESEKEIIDRLDVATLENILSNANFNDNSETFIRNALSVTCPICAESFPRTQIETMQLCEHSACAGCVKEYYKHEIPALTDHVSLNGLACFYPAHEISDDQWGDFFSCLQKKIKRWFHDQPVILEIYEYNVLHTAVGTGQIKKCGNSKCVNYFAIELDNQAPVAVRCNSCRFSQCQLCVRKWLPEHVDRTCQEYAEWLIDNDPADETVQTLRYLGETAIVCPNPKCGAIHQYQAGGCEHFTCPQCRTDFCRMCSTLFHSPSKGSICTVQNCGLQNSLHAHCSPNCFRETRIGEIAAIAKLLADHNVNVAGPLNAHPISLEKVCSVGGCGKATTDLCEDRLCEGCYKQFLCALVWQHQIEPWDIYEDNNLQQMLVKATVPVPETSTRNDLLTLCKTQLARLLGKPKKLTRPRT